MFFLREQRLEKVSLKLSEQTRAIIEEYADFVGMTQDQVVDIFLKNLLADPNFAKYLRSKRNSKRLVNKIFFGDTTMKLLNTCQNEKTIGFDMFKPDQSSPSTFSELGTDVTDEMDS